VAVLRSGTEAVDKKLVEAADLFPDGKRTRVKFLAQVLKKPFQKMGRRLRQQILAIDGATVLTHKGRIVTAGAIVSVPGGSKGGGRRAAAEALSKYGFALKISADGPITGFKDGKEIFQV
jgi:hypothetical protein